MTTELPAVETPSPALHRLSGKCRTRSAYNYESAAFTQFLSTIANDHFSTRHEIRNLSSMTTTSELEWRSIFRKAELSASEEIHLIIALVDRGVSPAHIAKELDGFPISDSEINALKVIATTDLSVGTLFYCATLIDVGLSPEEVREIACLLGDEICNLSDASSSDVQTIRELLEADCLELISREFLDLDDEHEELICDLRSATEISRAGLPLSSVSIARWTGMRADEILDAIDRGYPDRKTYREFSPTGLEFSQAASIEPPVARLATLGLDLDTSERWATADLSVKDIKSWLATGGTVDEADSWMSHGFPLAQARQWKRITDEPTVARAWLDNNCGLKQAKLWHRAGFNDPKGAGRWARRGFSPEHAAQWMRAGIGNSTTASRWRSIGIGPDDAARWLAAGVSVEAASRRHKNGIKPPQ